jgi:predicted 3-demethylubiquinone-9 3-methyltransferase (glyoxalase superfamily)
MDDNPRCRSKEIQLIPKISPFLWFDSQAEEAVNFYCSVFKNSKPGRVTRYGEAGPGSKGQAMSVTFELEGQQFMALNAGPHFHFTEAWIAKLRKKWTNCGPN